MSIWETPVVLIDHNITLPPKISRILPGSPQGKRRGHLYHRVLEKYAPLLGGAWSRSGRHGILGRDTSTERDVLSSASERVKKVGEGRDAWDFSHSHLSHGGRTHDLRSSYLYTAPRDRGGI